MQESSNKFKTKIKYSVITLVVFSLCLGGYYSYLVNASVSHVVRRSTLEKDSESLQSKVSDLESMYFTLESGITRELALKENYTETVKISYIDSSGNASVMLTRGN